MEDVESSGPRPDDLFIVSGKLGPIKRGRAVGYNYSGKDLYVINPGDAYFDDILLEDKYDKFKASQKDSDTPAHEFGHRLGIGHHKNTIMDGGKGYIPKENKPNLGIDRTLYKLQNKLFKDGNEAEFNKGYEDDLKDIKNKLEK